MTSSNSLESSSERLPLPIFMFPQEKEYAASSAKRKGSFPNFTFAASNRVIAENDFSIFPVRPLRSDRGVRK